MAQQDQSQRLSAFYLDQSTLKCKANCGFYGNPEWQGYCSMCYKQANQQLHQHHHQELLLQQQQQQQFLYYDQYQTLDRDFDTMSLGSPGPYGAYPSGSVLVAQPPVLSTGGPVILSNNTVKTPSSTPATPVPQQSQQTFAINSPYHTATTPTPTQYNQPNEWYFRDYTTAPTTPTTTGNNNNNDTSQQQSEQSLIDITSTTSQSSHDSSLLDLTGQQGGSYSPASFDRRASLYKDKSHMWADCLRYTNKFAKDFLNMEKQTSKSINELSDQVHNFYQTMADRFDSQLVYKGATPEQIEMLQDNMEKTLNEHIYQVISARIINEDEEHNIAIQKRIRSLNWITTEHLEIDIDFHHPVVHDLLDKAICQMIEMNSKTTSIDKLECIFQCSKTIFELLQVSPTTKSKQKAKTTTASEETDHNPEQASNPSNEDENKVENENDDEDEDNHVVPVSADQFLPVLVFVVIQANPPMLPADMKFLTRFSNPRRLMSGETGYYFTNLCCALEFIEKASGASLNISEEEFNKFVKGEAFPATSSQFDTYLCDGLRTMCSNDATMNRLREQSVARQSKIEHLMEQIDVHLETNRAKLREMHDFATNLTNRLKPNLPKFYQDIMAKNRELALKLLPSSMRQTQTQEPGNT